MVGEVLWGEQRVVTNPFKKVFNFPIGYQLGKGGTRAVRPKSPFNFPKGYQLGKGSTRTVVSPFNFPKGYQLGKGGTQIEVRRVRGER